MSDGGLYCVPGAIPAEFRDEHFRRLDRLFGEAVVRIEPAGSGYVYSFEADEIEELARFVRHERRCCPFLAFSIVVRPGAGHVELHVSGPPGTHEFLAAEFRHGPPG